jgi:hypothetical protein
MAFLAVRALSTAMKYKKSLARLASVIGVMLVLAHYRRAFPVAPSPQEKA